MGRWPTHVRRTPNCCDSTHFLQAPPSKWVAALPAVSCASPRGCRPPDLPLLPGVATAPADPPKALADMRT
eukprot:4934545-Alexandrium_andersonii.AAC.1